MIAWVRVQGGDQCADQSAAMGIEEHFRCFCQAYMVDSACSYGICCLHLKAMQAIAGHKVTSAASICLRQLCIWQIAVHSAMMPHAV